jgi:type IV pilus assembly protein PilW
MMLLINQIDMAEKAWVNGQSQINRQANKQQGFSLVELMVGLVIGLLATLVIMQVFSTFDAQKRTTAGTSDAQSSGSVALYSLQREVQLAGFGLPLYDTRYMPLICSAPPPDADGIADVDNDANAATPNVDMLPIRIIDGGVVAGATDTVIVHYGDSASGGAPVRVTAAPAGSTIPVTTSIACKNRDVVYHIRGTNCRATRINGVPAVDSVNVIDATGVDTSADDPRYLACLGDWRQITFQVSATNELIRQEISMRAAALGTSGALTALVTGVVNIQAQYGISARPDSNQIVSWVDATGAWAGTPGMTSIVCSAATANRNCIKAVRVAVVARNELLEKGQVSTACSSITAASTAENPLTGVCAWDATSADPLGVGWTAPKVDLSNNADWDRYRYKVYETIIPLRNIVWTGARL